MQVRAEEVAWDFAKEHDIDLVTVLPSAVFGPVLSARSDATSVQILKVGFLVALFPVVQIYVDAQTFVHQIIVSVHTLN